MVCAVKLQQFLNGASCRASGASIKFLGENPATDEAADVNIWEAKGFRGVPRDSNIP